MERYTDKGDGGRDRNQKREGNLGKRHRGAKLRLNPCCYSNGNFAVKTPITSVLS